MVFAISSLSFSSPFSDENVDWLKLAGTMSNSDKSDEDDDDLVLVQCIQ